MKGAKKTPERKKLVTSLTTDQINSIMKRKARRLADAKFDLSEGVIIEEIFNNVYWAGFWDGSNTQLGDYEH